MTRTIRTRISLPFSLIALLTLLFTSLPGPVRGQEQAQTQPAAFLRANDRFALNLLKTAQEQEPNRNIIVAPLPVSLTFAAILDGTSETASIREIRAVFEWNEVPGLNEAGQMLLARFAKPKPYPVSHLIDKSRHDLPSEKYLRSGKPEELWISGAFLYRGDGALSQDFMDRVSHDFGFKFRAVGKHTSQPDILVKNWDTALPMPKIVGENDFWITSVTHLRSSWAGNTFVGAERKTQRFDLSSGDVVQADFLKSETFVYPYVHTEEFEAVILSCWQATILFILPGASTDIAHLEATLAKDPNIIDAVLVKREGDVQFPPFHFTYEGDLRESLRNMGLERIFWDPNSLLRMSPEVKGGYLKGVAQKTEITVDENGIRAESGLIVHGVYGGILAARAPFHMVLNRPFLFLIRDPVTGGLLFAGVIMNPIIN